MPAVPLILVGAAATGVAATIGTAVAATLVGATVSGIAATAIGTGLIAGTLTAVQGGSVSDVLKSAVIGGVATYVGGYAGDFVGSSVASATGSALAGTIAGNVASGIAQSVVRGGDIEQGIIGGLAASAGAVLGNIPGFSGLPKPVQAAVTATARTAVTGGDIPAAVAQSLITSTGILDKALSSIPGADTVIADSKNKDAVQLVTGTLSGALTAALQGKDVSAAAQRALVNASADILAKNLFDGIARERLNKEIAAAQANYTSAQKAQADLKTNYDSQNYYVEKYNEVVNNVKSMGSEHERLVKDYNDKKAVWQAKADAGDIEGANAYVEEVNAAAKAADEYVKTYNKYWEDNKGNLDTYKAKIDELQAAFPELETKYNDATKSLETSSMAIGKDVGTFTDNSNQAFVKALDPNFDAAQYKSINGLGEDVDAYEHYLSTGMTQGLITNDKDKTIAAESAKFKSATGVDLPEYIVERARTTSNANRDAVIKDYVDGTLADKSAYEATKAKAAESVMKAYEQAGYSQKQIDYLISSGAAGTFVNQIMNEQRGSVEQLRDYAKAVGEAKGTDSAEYKAAYKDALGAMADYGGYGVTKGAAGEFVSTEYGKLDPNTLVPVTKDRAWIDPVTGRLHVEITGVGSSQQMKPLSELGDYSALWSKGKSANPPAGGGSSVFGDGSGASMGLFGGLQLVAVDDKSGDTSAKLYDAGNGFALIAYSDGTGRVVNRNTDEVIWLEPADTQKILEQVPQAKPANTPPTPVDITKPPPNFSTAAANVASAVSEAINEGQTTSTAASSSGGGATSGGATAGGYTWSNLSGGTTSGGATSGGTTSGGATSGGSASAGVTSPNTALTADQQTAYNSLTSGQKLIFDQLLRQNVDITTAIGTAQKATNLQLSGLSSQMQSAYEGLSEGQKALVNQLSQQGVDVTSAIIRAQNLTADQIAGLSEQTKTQYNNLTAGQKAIVDQLSQQGIDLTSAIIRAQNTTGEQIAGVAGQVGDLSKQVTGLSTDLQSKYISLTQGQKDLADQLAKQGVDLGTAIATAAAATEQGFQNVYGQMATNQTATEKAIADTAAATQAKAAAEAAATRQAQAASALQTQRLGNLNSLTQMLMQSPDVAGQQVTVKAADPSKIGYIYDWSSIFANPSQQQMFVTPYAQGGAVRGELDEVNDELLKLLRG